MRKKRKFLTDEQKEEVVFLTNKGLSDARIAELLSTSVNTIRAHTTNFWAKKMEDKGIKIIKTIFRRYDINGAWTHDERTVDGEYDTDPNSMWRVHGYLREF